MRLAGIPNNMAILAMNVGPKKAEISMVIFIVTATTGTVRNL